MDLTVQPPTLQEIKDKEHLKLLSIFHYVVGGLAIASSFFFLFHILIGLIMLLSPSSFGNQLHHGPPRILLGVMFVVFPVIFILVSWVLGAATIYSGVCIKNRQNRMYSLVVAGINCLNMPIGTALGIFTILVLVQDSVKRVYKS